MLGSIKTARLTVPASPGCLPRAREMPHIEPGASSIFSREKGNRLPRGGIVSPMKHIRSVRWGATNGGELTLHRAVPMWNDPIPISCSSRGLKVSVVPSQSLRDLFKFDTQYKVSPTYDLRSGSTWGLDSEARVISPPRLSWIFRVFDTLPREVTF